MCAEPISAPIDDTTMNTPSFRSAISGPTMFISRCWT